MKVGGSRAAEGHRWGPGAMPPMGSRGNAPGGGQGAMPPEAEKFSHLDNKKKTFPDT